MDTFFFRDARSFIAGDDTTAEFTFPTPLTFFGALGTAVLSNTEENNLKKFMAGDWVHPKLGKYDADLEDTNLKLKGPFLRKGIFDNRGELFFHPPANLWITDSKRSRKSLPALPYKKDWVWDIKQEGLMPLQIPDEPHPKIKQLDEYISIDVLTQYLSNNLKTINSKSSDDFYVTETRYGHFRSSDSMTVEEKYLYTAPRTRFKDNVSLKNYHNTGFALLAEGIEKTDLPDETLYLGGERRTAMIQVFDDDEIIQKQAGDLKNIQSSKRFLIYFATPTIFKNGWFTDRITDFDGADLVGAAVNKPLYVSGWKKNKYSFRGMPRKIKRAVPAGSVYFFEAKKWDDNRFKQIYDEYHFGKSFSDEYPSAGFGIGLLGCW